MLGRLVPVRERKKEMIKIRFERNGVNYKRIIEFPGRATPVEDSLVLPKKWLAPETWTWVTPFHEYSRKELAAEGEVIAACLLGSEGIAFMKSAASDPRKIVPVVILESGDLPEVAGVPWEIACLEGEFLATNPSTPLIRRPAHVQLKDHLRISKPLRLAMISASPRDQGPLMVEEENLSAALALSEQVTRGKMIVDEVFNCTRDKLREVFQENTYDLVYFTGHGAFSRDTGTGYLLLETPEGTTDQLSARDFCKYLRRQKDPALVFLNCCNAAAVGMVRSEGWQGFGDVARKALEAGVPEVIATQSAIFDDTGRKMMKYFFEEFYKDDEYNAAHALSVARSEVEDDHSQFHDFYHFVLLSALAPDARIEPRQTPELAGAGSQATAAVAAGADVEVQTQAQVNAGADWRQKVVYRTPNYMALDRNFIGRFRYISQIEDAWWQDAVKAVGIHGLGGIGKTFLCNRMEERTLSHPVKGKRLNKSIWIDFREGAGSTLSGFLTQLKDLAFDLGYHTYQRVLDDQDKYPRPLEKLRPLVEHLQATVPEGRILLILDNLETVVDEQGNFHDPELGAWFSELLAHTPPAWKVLVTCRYRFPLFKEGRQLAKAKWFQLTELGLTERFCLINQHAGLRRLSDEEKRQVIKAAGGHPYLINLVAEYLQRHGDLPHVLACAAQETAAYARLDCFLSLLAPEELDWLVIFASFPLPRHRYGLLMAKAIRHAVENPQAVEDSFNTSLRRLIDLSLVALDDEGSIDLHPLMVYQLLQNKDSRFCRTREEIRKINQAIGTFFYSAASKVDNRPAKARVLLQGVESALEQDDIKLLNAYLQKCAGTFHGFVPVSAFCDIVRRAESVLMEQGDEASFHTLGFCGQTLMEMRSFQMALSILENMLSQDKFPDQLRGNVLHIIGRVYEEQRMWDRALESYQKALEWYNKTENYIELGGTYHQIGMVYEGQGDFSNSSSAFAKGLMISLQTEYEEGIEGNFRSLCRILPNLLPEQLEELKKMLLPDVFQQVIEQGK